jgi:hypothetical protein
VLKAGNRAGPYSVRSPCVYHSEGENKIDKEPDTLVDAVKLRRSSNRHDLKGIGKFFFHLKNIDNALYQGLLSKFIPKFGEENGIGHIQGMDLVLLG